MMHLANHQETEPHCWDPASLADDLAKYEAGFYVAAATEPVERLNLARDVHCDSDHPFSRGYRDMTFGCHEAAGR